MPKLKSNAMRPRTKNEKSVVFLGQEIGTKYLAKINHQKKGRQCPLRSKDLLRQCLGQPGQAVPPPLSRGAPLCLEKVLGLLHPRVLVLEVAFHDLKRLVLD